MNVGYSASAVQQTPTREPNVTAWTMWALSLCLLGLLSGCGRTETVAPGRGVDHETGPMAKVYPSGEPSRNARHGLWRGMDGERVAWEVRYTRGLPAGPYREWNAEGDLSATWPYNWNGKIEGWARWFQDGDPLFKLEISPDQQPKFDPIGRADDLLEWARKQSESDTP